MSSRIKEEVKKIFTFYCEVKILDNGGAVVTSRFPENYQDDKLIETIPKFAFPCEFQFTSIQKYSFVLTDIESKWRFGFCRHDPETQTAMVVVTYLPWHTTFRKLLDVLGQLRNRSDEEFRDFITTVYKETVPDPGATLKVYYDNRECCFEFQRPPQHYQLPRVLKDHNLTIYYNFVEPKEMIAVFASMLAERRIIFTSSNFERLSCCVQAANEFLYPMQWQHIFVPILPMKLKDTLMAPMPYLIGVPLPVLKTIPRSELEEVVILNCDTKRFQSPFDDVESMPPKIVHRMKDEFHRITRPNQDVGDRVSKIFLGALVQMIGGYRDALKYETGEKIKWDKDIFVARSSSAHMQDYLKKLVEIQIFNQFIDDRLYKLNAGLGITDEFENEVFRQAENFGKKHKGYKDILRNVKDKTNPAMKTAVKTVKESSKGVKTAYKDLKSKLRDINPNHSPNFHSHISNSHHSGMDTLSQTSISVDFSAPSSPINSKRQNLLDSSPISSNTDDVLSNDVHLHPNGYSKDNLSKTVTPASSYGSLNFNLTQELEDHPLFKSPKVDRSLKPSSSFDLNGSRPRGLYSAPAIIPRTNNKSSSNKPMSTSTSTTLPLQDNPSLSKIIVNDSIIDKPPNKPPPAVPPRRHHGGSSAAVAAAAASASAAASSSTTSTSTILPSYDLIKLETSYNNNYDDRRADEKSGGGVVVDGHHQQTTDYNNLQTRELMRNNNVINHLHLRYPQYPPQQHPQSTQHHQQQQQQPQHNSILPKHLNLSHNLNQPPIPTPRYKKESPALPVEPSGDLIQLNDNTGSFDLEDFDPLNLNARPIPDKLYPTNSTSSSVFLASGSHNHHLPLKTDDDSELLSKYGLDSFLQPSSTKTPTTNNWTFN